MTDCFSLINAMRRDFSVEIVTSIDTLREAQRLRYQVFCEERGVLPGHDGIESDEYDPRSRHVVLRRQSNRELVGTVRVITAATDGPFAYLPMQRVCDPVFLRGLPIATTGEVSRFALARDRHSPNGKSDLLLRLALMQGILRISRDLRLTHWCAGMEQSLLRLLRFNAICYEPVGPVIDYHGLRQPAVGVIDTILATVRRERPAIWDYVTEFGTLASAPAQERLAA